MTTAKKENIESSAQKTTSSALAFTLATELQTHASDFLNTSAPESLHQFRVTLRKIRAFASAGKRRINEEQRSEIREHIRWLSEMTGPARDADVQLAHEEQNAQKLPPSAHLKMEKQKHESYRKVMASLQMDRFKQFCALIRSVPVAEGEVDTLDPETIRQRIHRILKKSLKQGAVLDQSSDDEAFHELRKLLKKLRYTLGFLLQTAPDKKLKRAEKHFKEIQDYLGFFQDQTVRATELNDRAGELIASEISDHQELFDTGMQAGQTQKSIQNLKAGFPVVFQKFSKAMHKHLAELC